jgi:hypothetical protein
LDDKVWGIVADGIFADEIVVDGIFADEIVVDGIVADEIVVDGIIGALILSNSELYLDCKTLISSLYF